MLVPDDRFFQIAGLRANQVVPGAASLIHDWRDWFDEFAEIRFSAAGGNDIAHRVPKLHHRGKIGALGRDRVLDRHADRTSSREPLLAPQHRTRAAKDGRNHRQIGLRRDPKRAEIKSG